MIAEEDNLGRRCGRSLAVAVMGALLLCSALQAQPVNFNDPALLAETAPLPKRLRGAEARSLSSSSTVSLSYLEGKRPTAIEAITTSGPDLFGDKVSTFNGSLQFEHQDLELPGNSVLPVALSRRHVAGRLPEVRGIFGDWDIQLPRVTGSFSEFGWQTDTGGTDRCTGYSAPRHVTAEQILGALRDGAGKGAEDGDFLGAG